MGVAGPCLLVAALLLACGARAAAAPSGEPIQGEERSRILERLQERQREIVSLHATVVQRKRDPLLKAEAVSRGSLLFTRPNRFRWEVATPERIIIVADGATLLVYRPDRKEVERRDLRADFGARAAMDFLTAGMGLAVLELERRFRVDLYREEERLTLMLRPRSRWAGQAIASIALSQDEGDAIPRRLVMTTPKGGRTETSLTSVVINPQLPEDAFTLRLGPEVRVIDVGRPPDDRDSGR